MNAFTKLSLIYLLVNLHFFFHWYFIQWIFLLCLAGPAAATTISAISVGVRAAVAKTIGSTIAIKAPVTQGGTPIQTPIAQGGASIAPIAPKAIQTPIAQGGASIAIQAPSAQGGAPKAPKNGCSRGSHHSLLGEGAEDGSRDGDNNRRWLDHGRGVRALPDTGLVAAVSDGLGAADATGVDGAQIVAGHLLGMDISCNTH